MDQMAFCLLIVSTFNFNSNTNEHSGLKYVGVLDFKEV